MVQNAQKALGAKFSPEFQYLMQKKFHDKNWDEGSSITAALKVAKNIGFLPASAWTFTSVEDRKLPYYKYIKLLQVISDEDIAKMVALAAPYKIKAYAAVPTDRDSMAQAIDESKAGILCRYVIGSEWWTPPIEPIQPPKISISGHAVTDCNYNGDSTRTANTWGVDWCDKGTGYHLNRQYRPTEAWIPYYNFVPVTIQKQLLSRTTLKGKVLDIIHGIYQYIYS